MKKFIWLILLFPFALNGQVVLTIEGKTLIDTTYIDYLCGSSYGIPTNRTQPTIFTFKNNYVESCNIHGYMLEAGTEIPVM
jgi:hypothetical protein